MFSIAICDDDQIFVDYEKKIIDDYLGTLGIRYAVQTYFSSDSLIANLNQLNAFDLILLDVEMPGINGVEIAKSIRMMNKDIKIVFVSAFIDYSTAGYRVNAFRYILKRRDDYQNYLSECLDSVLRELSDKKKVVKFNFSIGERELVISDILYVESHINDVVFYALSSRDKEVLQIRSSLKKINKIIEPLDFISISAKHSVNLRHVVSISRYEIVLDNDKKLPVSQKKYADANRLFMLYKGRCL